MCCVCAGAQAWVGHLGAEQVARIANLALVDCNKSGDHAGAVVASRHIRQVACISLLRSRPWPGDASQLIGMVGLDGKPKITAD